VWRLTCKPQPAPGTPEFPLRDRPPYPVTTALRVSYFAIGRLFALPTFNVPSFRRAAWVIALVAYVAHIWFEHVRLRSAPRVIALHVSAGVAAMVHNIGLNGAAVGPAWLISLVAWPLAPGIPAFLATLVGALALARRDKPVQRP